MQISTIEEVKLMLFHSELGAAHQVLLLMIPVGVNGSEGKGPKQVA